MNCGSNNTFLKEFLDKRFFYYWKRAYYNNISKIPNLYLDVSPICNLKCTYCYYKNFSKKLYPIDIASQDSIISNLKKIFEFFIYNKIYVPNIQLFSGEFFNLSYFEELLNICRYYSRSINKQVQIIIPTNGTFLGKESSICKIQNIINTSFQDKLKILLSLSIDGKYSDKISREPRCQSSLLYNDVYYNRAIQFSDKNNFSFHPMICPDTIEYGKENLDWYISLFKDYYGDDTLRFLRKIYFLEVRNPEWSDKSLNFLEDFISYFVSTIYSFYNDPEKFISSYSFISNMGLLKPLFSLYDDRCFENYSCSIQDSMEIRLGDLSLVNCHRLSYEDLIAGKLEFTNNNREMIIRSIKPELYTTVKGYNPRKSGKCASCNFNTFCSLGCLGCNYEVNKDPFMISNEICRMEKSIYTSAIRQLDNIGIVDDLIKIFSYSKSNFMKKKAYQVSWILNQIKG